MVKQVGFGLWHLDASFSRVAQFKYDGFVPFCLVEVFADPGISFDSFHCFFPLLQPLFDNLSVIRHQFKSNDKRSIKINELLEQNKLLITPLAYIRGRSLQKAFFIVDEAQNLTPHEVKTVITRAGEGTKVIFTGDIHQIDHPYLDKRSNGLTYLISRMKGQDVFAHITLEKGERSELAELASNLL